MSNGDSARFCRLLIVALTASLGCGSNDPWTEPMPQGEKVVVTTPDTPAIDLQFIELASGERTAIELTAKLTEDQLKTATSSAAKIKSITCQTFEQVEPLLKHVPLEAIVIHGKVNDSQFKLICMKTTLLRLNLPKATLSNSGLTEVTKLNRLELLRFASPKVTDEAFKYISQVQSLKFLHLLGVPITDAALPEIGKLKNLESFYLDGGKTTNDGLVKFSKARPDIHFHKDQLHLDGSGHD